MRTVNKFLILVFIIINFQLNATTFYVTPSGAGLLDGSSWGNAAPGSDLQTIINNSLVGDEVWVSCGIYTTTATTDRTISFSMKNGVTIYGSFQGTESLLSERDISCDPCTILSGEIGAAGNTDNSYTVVSNQLLDDSAIIDGFTISGGNDDGRGVSSAGNGLGGGLYNHGYGGGFCHPIIRNCLFTNNRAAWGGGAFNNGYNGNSQPTYINCVFYQNQAYIEAGGMDSYGVNNGIASPTLINTVFIENTSDTNVGAMYAWGGNNGSSHPVLINCEFVNNSATNGYGGAFIADNHNDTGVGSSGTCTVTLQNCIVRNNTATGLGPQFYIRGSGPQVIATYSDIDMTNQNSPHIISGVGTGNIDQDPLFVNMANPKGIDNCWFTNDDGLQLQSSSPCINTGNNSNTYPTDIVGNSRIEETLVDIGAYEYSSTLGITNESLINSTKVYPNPTNDWITIEQKVVSVDEVSIISITGKRIYLPENGIVVEQNLNRIKLNLKYLPAGTYIVRTRHSANIILKK